MKNNLSFIVQKNADIHNTLRVLFFANEYCNEKLFILKNSTLTNILLF